MLLWSLISSSCQKGRYLVQIDFMGRSASRTHSRANAKLTDDEERAKDVRIGTRG